MTAEPHFRPDDKFIHRCCKCGGDGPFGFGVSLRRGKLGTWYCAYHKPQPQNAGSTSSPSSNTDAERPVDGKDALTANGKPATHAAPSFNKTNEETKL
jgi:hypothetical protein